MGGCPPSISTQPAFEDTPRTTIRDAECEDSVHQSLLELESTITASGSPFGKALARRLRNAGPFVTSKFNLEAWLAELDRECAQDDDPSATLHPRAPLRQASTRSWSRGWENARQRCHSRRSTQLAVHQSVSIPDDSGTPSLDDYLADITAVFGIKNAAEALAAFEDGTLQEVLRDEELVAKLDAHIRANPPPPPAPGEEASEETLPEVCAQLYLTLRSGFIVLPPGTVINTPTDTRNSRSVTENIEDVRAEYKRLRDLGHVITWKEAQERHPELRNRHPDHVLALGCVIKTRSDGTKKVRVTIDPSRGTSKAPPHRPVPGLNEQIEHAGLLFGCRLATVHHAAAAMRRNCWSFGADEADAYMQIKHSVDSLRFVAVRLDGELLVYNACAFGINSMCAQQQRLATIFVRIVMRRWRDAGFDIGPRPAPDQSQRFADPASNQVHLFAYLDDFFGTGFESKEDADRAYDILCSSAIEFGIELKFAADKTSPPTLGPREFIGVLFCSRSMTMQLTTARVQKMLDKINSVKATDTITVGELRSLIGVLQFATVVFEMARLYLRFLLNMLRAVGPSPAKGLRLTFSPGARSDLDMWQRILKSLNLNARPVSAVLHHSTIEVELYTDASFRAGGWWFGGRFRAWLWPEGWRSGRIGDFSRDDAIAIGELEALALLIALRDLAPLCAGGPNSPGRRLVCHIDNIGLVGMLRKHSTRSAAALPIIKEIDWICVTYGIVLAPKHIASELNEASDALTRSHQMDPADLLEILKRWAASHPDATSWAPRAPSRPDLFSHIERHPYEPPGRPFNGLAYCTADFLVDDN